MAQIKSPPPPNAGIHELTEYIAYLQRELQYETDLRDRQSKDLESDLANRISDLESRVTALESYE